MAKFANTRVGRIHEHFKELAEELKAAKEENAKEAMGLNAAKEANTEERVSIIAMQGCMKHLPPGLRLLDLDRTEIRGASSDDRVDVAGSHASSVNGSDHELVQNNNRNDLGSVTKDNSENGVPEISEDEIVQGSGQEPGDKTGEKHVPAHSMPLTDMHATSWPHSHSALLEFIYNNRKEGHGPCLIVAPSLRDAEKWMQEIEISHQEINPAKFVRNNSLSIVDVFYYKTLVTTYSMLASEHTTAEKSNKRIFARQTGETKVCISCPRRMSLMDLFQVKDSQTKGNYLVLDGRVHAPENTLGASYTAVKRLRQHFDACLILPRKPKTKTARQGEEEDATSGRMVKRVRTA